MIYPTKKMNDKWFGPFEVVEKVRVVAYRLAIPRTWRQVHPVFNVDLLKEYQDPVFGIQQTPPPPPPEIIDGHEEYEIERILDLKFRRRRLYYLVKWQGYTEQTWEPASELKRHTQQAVTDFHRNHPEAPRIGRGDQS